MEIRFRQKAIIDEGGDPPGHPTHRTKKLREPIPRIPYAERNLRHSRSGASKHPELLLLHAQIRITSPTLLEWMLGTP